MDVDEGKLKKNSPMHVISAVCFKRSSFAIRATEVLELYIFINVQNTKSYIGTELVNIMLRV